MKVYTLSNMKSNALKIIVIVEKFQNEKAFKKEST